MTTVYQISPTVTLFKDMVFGWVVQTPNATIIVNQSSKSQCEVLQQGLIGNILFNEARLAVNARIQELDCIEQQHLKAEDELRAATEKLVSVNEAKAKEVQKVQAERTAFAQSLVKAMQEWFEQRVPTQVFDVSQTPGGYVYAKVLRCNGVYAVLSNQMETLFEVQTLEEVAEVILRRWW